MNIKIRNLSYIFVVLTLFFIYMFSLGRVFADAPDAAQIQSVSKDAKIIPLSTQLSNGTSAGYYIITKTGSVLSFGSAQFYGDLTSIPNIPNNQVADMVITPNDLGYYILTKDGGVYTFGNAQFLGSVYNITNAPIKNAVSLKLTPNGLGYYVLTTDGGVYTFGNAQFFGSLYNIPQAPNKVPVSLSITNNNQGYYIETEDGGIYTFGNAQFLGSVYNIPQAPVKNAMGLKLTPGGNGYYVETTDGGVYTFGSAQFFGSIYNIQGAPNKTVSDIALTANGDGYYALTADGGVYTFGNAQFEGADAGDVAENVLTVKSYTQLPYQSSINFGILEGEIQNNSNTTMSNIQLTVTGAFGSKTITPFLSTLNPDQKTSFILGYTGQYSTSFSFSVTGTPLSSTFVNPLKASNISVTYNSDGTITVSGNVTNNSNAIVTAPMVEILFFDSNENVVSMISGVVGNGTGNSLNPGATTTFSGTLTGSVASTVSNNSDDAVKVFVANG